MGGWQIFIRYLLEYMMLIPGAVCSLIPVQDDLRLPFNKVVVRVSALLLSIMIAGSVISSAFDIAANCIIFPAVVIMFFLFHSVCSLGWNRLLFVYCNAAMLMAWPTLLTNFLTAKNEAADSGKPFTLLSGVVCLTLSVFVILFYYRFLSKRLPVLLALTNLEKVWNWFFLVPLSVTMMFLWMIPYDPANLLVGRIQVISVFLTIIILFLIYGFYQFFWYVAGRLQRQEALEWENRMLHAQEIRFTQVQENLQETRRMRHDFRQHLRVLSELADAGEYEEIRHYLGELVKITPVEKPVYSTNRAVDALAAYYQAEAEAQKIRVQWSLFLPDQLPVSENDFSVILGNLMENALRSVKELPEADRVVKVKANTIGDGMMGLGVSNRYSGEIIMGKNGLPVTKGRQGIGLSSVALAVRQNGGTMAVEPKNGWFTVDIIFNFQ